MKSLVSMVVLGLMASSASAADVQISRSALASVGLPGFVKMSDVDAMSVRGKGYTVVVSGISIASASHAVSINGFAASSSGSANSVKASGLAASVAVSHTGSAFAAGVSSVSVH